MQDVQAEIDLLRARCPDLPAGSGIPPRDPLPPHCPDVPPGSEHLSATAEGLAPDADSAIRGAPGTSDVLDGLNLDPPPAPQGPSATGTAGGAASAGGGSPERQR